MNIFDSSLAEFSPETIEPINPLDISSQTSIPSENVPHDSAAHLAMGRPPWNPLAIAWICVFFTMLPAGIMYALNFERLGAPEKKKRALFLVLSASLIYYIALTGAVLLMGVHPGLEKMSVSVNLWFTFISIGMAWYFYLRQQPLFKAQIRSGARKAPLYMPIFLSGLWMIAFAGVLVGWNFLQETRHIERFNTAVTLMEEGEYQQAEAIFKEYKTRYPDDAAAFLNLASIYLQTERVPQAKQELEALLRQDPNNKDAQEILKEIEPL